MQRTGPSHERGEELAEEGVPGVQLWCHRHRGRAGEGGPDTTATTYGKAALFTLQTGEGGNTALSKLIHSFGAFQSDQTTKRWI